VSFQNDIENTFFGGYKFPIPIEAVTFDIAMQLICITILPPSLAYLYWVSLEHPNNAAISFICN
jgi:hypothetical protein